MNDKFMNAGAFSLELNKANSLGHTAEIRHDSELINQDGEYLWEYTEVGVQCDSCHADTAEATTTQCTNQYPCTACGIRKLDETLNDDMECVACNRLHYEKMAGNWHKITSWSWSKPPRPDDVHIHYMAGRDSDILSKSNFLAAQKIMKDFMTTDDDVCWIENHTSSLVGWVDAFVIRIFDEDGNITPAAIKFRESVLLELDDYPILDDDLFSEMESEEAYEGFCEALKMEGIKMVDAPSPADNPKNPYNIELQEWLENNGWDDVVGSWPDGDDIREGLDALRTPHTDDNFDEDDMLEEDDYDHVFKDFEEVMVRLYDLRLHNTAYENELVEWCENNGGDDMYWPSRELTIEGMIHLDLGYDNLGESSEYNTFESVMRYAHGIELADPSQKDKLVAWCVDNGARSDICEERDIVMKGIEHLRLGYYEIKDGE